MVLSSSPPYALIVCSLHPFIYVGKTYVARGMDCSFKICTTPSLVGVQPRLLQDWQKHNRNPHYAAGLGKSAPLLGSSWENEADSASQPCAGEPGSGCWGWTKDSLHTQRRAQQAWAVTNPTCPRACTWWGPWRHRLRHYESVGK